MEQQAAGCFLTKDDVPAIISSITCCIIFVIYGASSASLGPALPALALHYEHTIAQMGIMFTSRGIGYLFGIGLSGLLLNWKNNPFSKEFVASLSQIITGIILFSIHKINNFYICIILFIIQGSFFGIINNVTNVLLPELWEKRVQPWMQGMHACFGIGAIIGPAIVGYAGYEFDFILLFLISFLPTLVMLICFVLGIGSSSNNTNRNGKAHTSTPSSPTSPRSRLSKTSVGKVKASFPATDKKKGRNAPWLIKAMIALFFLFYVGAEAGYAGWISSYSLLVHITERQSKAAYLSSIFWAALTAGRVTAIPAAIFLSSTTMLRIELALACFAGICCLFFLSLSYTIASFISAFSGFALSAMFPIMITIFTDYGYLIDVNTTTLFMIGATMGEAMIPVCIGILMSFWSPYLMPFSIFFCIIIMLGLYLTFHYLSEQEKRNDEMVYLGKVLSKSLSYNPLNTSDNLEEEDGDPRFTHEEDLYDNDLEDDDFDGIEMMPYEVVG
jgi:FHS family Na+ dependent glucose MFS transporter 1